MKRLLVLAVVAAALAISSCSRGPEAIVTFAPYSKEALDAARGKGQAVVVFATAEWCGPCQRLHREALADPEVKAAMDALTRLKIDGTPRSPAIRPLLDEHGIGSYPTLVFYDAAGREVQRLEGVEPSEVLIAAARKAAAAR
jgi:thiol:disulfide interchange protein DsbD